MNKWVWIFIILFLCREVYALRVNQAPRLSNPPTQEEISVLNKFLADIWNITNGRYQLDVVTTPKTNAKNGELWVIFTSPTGRLQWKANDTIFTSP